jgi:hypothetical protein
MESEVTCSLIQAKTHAWASEGPQVPSKEVCTMCKARGMNNGCKGE